jgi:integrase
MLGRFFFPHAFLSSQIVCGATCSVPISCAGGRLQYLRHDERPANSPLFAAPGNLAFTREYLIRRLRTLALSAGLGAGVWNGHSFRRGAATWANLQGLPGDTIQLLGRWNSTAYKLYIDLAPEERIDLSRRFQSGGQPPA